MSIFKRKEIKQLKEQITSLKEKNYVLEREAKEDEGYNFNVSYEPEFTEFFARLYKKYPEKLFDIEGIGKQLDFSKFSRDFFSTKTTTADVSVDANANVDEMSVVAYQVEMPKPFFRINALYLLWKYGRQLYGNEEAEKIVEGQISGDYYINDLSNINMPYSYYGGTPLYIEDGEKVDIISMHDLYELHATRAVNNEVALSNVYVFDKGGTKTKATRVLKHAPHNDLLVITTRGGHMTIVTEDHPVIMADGSEKMAVDLKLNEELKSSEYSYEDHLMKGMIVPDDRIIFEAHNYAFAQMLKEQCDNYSGRSEIILNEDKGTFIVRLMKDQVKEEDYYKIKSIGILPQEYKEHYGGMVYDITTESGHFISCGLTQHNCFNFSTYDVATQGLPFVKKIISGPPKHLSSFVGQMIHFTVYASNSIAGACGLADFLIVMAYFVDKLKKENIYRTEEDFHKAVKQEMQSFIYSCNQPFRGGHQCFDEETQLLTREGFKTWDQLKEGELVYTLKDGALNIQPIQKMNIYDYDGIMHEYITPEGKQLITPEHRVLYTDGEDFKIAFSSELLNCDSDIAIPTAPMKGDKKEVKSSVFGLHEKKDIDKLQHELFVDGTPTRVIPVGDEYLVTPIAERQEVLAINEVDYKGKVWCPTTEDGIVVARRYGSIFISGNSGFYNISIFDKQFLEKMVEDYVFEDDVTPNIDTILYLQDMYLDLMNEITAISPITFPVTTGAFATEEKDGEIDVVDKEYLMHLSKKNLDYGFINFYFGKTSTLSSCCFHYDQMVGVRVDNEFDHGKIGYIVDKYADKEVMLRLNGDLYPARTVKLKRNNKKLYKIETGGMKELLVTEDHLHPTENGDKETVDLIVGDKLVLDRSFFTEFFDEIISIEEFESDDEYVYCFEMLDQTKPYFTLANGIVTHNCRLRSDSTNEYFNSFGSGSSKIGSLGVVSLNLPRLAYLYKDEESFLEKLGEISERATKINNIKRFILRKRIKNHNLPLYDYGFMDLNKQYSTIGDNGINEAVEEMGYSILSPEGQTFVNKILNKINEVNDIAQKKYKSPHNQEQVPAENSAIKLADKDKLMGYQNKYPLYSNQFIPLTTGADLLDRIKLQGLFDDSMSGGAICHLNVESAITDPEQMYNLLLHSAKQGVIYLAVNYTLLQCKNNHMTVGKTKICSVCGEDIETEYTRVVGFLTATKNWSKTRRQEDWPHRVFYQGIEAKGQ